MQVIATQAWLLVHAHINYTLVQAAAAAGGIPGTIHGGCMHAQGTLLMAMANGLPVVSMPYHFALELLQARTHAPLSRSSLYAIKSF